MEKGICYKHGRIMLHSGKCKECREEEQLSLSKEKTGHKLTKLAGERQHITDGSHCWCEPRKESFSKPVCPICESEKEDNSFCETCNDWKMD